MEFYKFNDDIMNEIDSKIVCNFEPYPRDSKIITNQRFVHIDNGEQCATHRACFY